MILRVDFTRESRGLHRPILSGEVVKRDGEMVLKRPDDKDQADSGRLTQTYLEQVNSNQEFRPIADFLRTVRYLHLVPHLLREPGRQAVGWHRETVAAGRSGPST